MIQQEIEKVLKDKWIEWYGEYPVEDFAENMTEMSQAIIELLISKIPEETPDGKSLAESKKIHWWAKGRNQYRAELLELFQSTITEQSY